MTDDPTDMNDEALTELVDKVRNVKFKSEREHNQLVNRLVAYVKHGGIIDYMRTSENPTVEQVVMKAKEIRNRKPSLFLPAS